MYFTKLKELHRIIGIELILDNGTRLVIDYGDNPTIDGPTAFYFRDKLAGPSMFVIQNTPSNTEVSQFAFMREGVY